MPTTPIREATLATDRYFGWLRHPFVPKAAVPVMLAGFWMLEALVHVAVLGEGTSFLGELLYPDRHELWMRFVVAAMIVALGIAWNHVAEERRRRIDSMLVYQRKLQEMAGRLVYGESEERREFARRLHEDIGQQLTAARMFLGSSECADADSQGARTVARILERVVLECRELAEELSPPVLEEFGLVPALQSLASRVMRRSGASVEIDSAHACAGLTREALLVTFQVLAEVVEIAAEKPQTTRVVVECTQQGEDLAFAVRWNGVSDEEFFSAEERISNIGGRTRVTVDAVGTVFTALVPAGI